MALWGVARARVGSEQRAADQLVRAGIDVYCPKIELRGKKSALFPGYLFFEVDERWRDVFSDGNLYAVRGLLMQGEQLRTLKQRVIDELRARADSDGIVRVEIGDARIKAGVPVRVTRGKFEGLLGVFDCYTRGDRVKVLLNLLGRVTYVDLSVDVVERDASNAQLSRAKRKKLLTRQRKRVLRPAS